MITATKPKIHCLSVSKARTNLGELVRRVQLNKELFILERNGIPAAAIMDVDDLEDYLELQDPKLKRQIAEGYAAYRRGDVRDARELRQRKAKTKKQ